MIEQGIQLRGPLDLHRTLGPLVHGRGDRTIRLEHGGAWLAFRTPDGAATLHLAHHAPTAVLARAWGPGAEAALSAAPMLELLEPYRGQRGRVQRYLEVGRITAPRYGHRMAPRSIAPI